MKPAGRIADLQDVNQRQCEKIAALLARIQELEARLAKDSSDSSQSPSRDGLKRTSKSVRHG